jgi:NhaA family Na+:H+ antiporter
MKIIESFMKKESSPGILLMIAAFFALVFSNSFLSPQYEAFLNIPVVMRFGAFHLDKPLLLWINDGLMAVFFLMIGLEIKREILNGHLSSLGQIALPGIAALGGMVVPALIYFTFNKNDPLASHGWAIPTATDIAFALGILSLLGKKVPVSLKVFLMALAIIDDLGAIIIIAIFYTSDLSPISMSVSFVSLGILVGLNIFGFTKKTAYLIVGAILWVSVLKSGVHATLAGVALAFTIPMKAKDEHGVAYSPLKDIEHYLHYWVAFFIIPLFAFVNAGVNISAISLDQMTGPVPLGIIFGLFIGKQLGVFTFSWVAIKLKIAKLPEGSDWLSFYGVTVLTGIGFTMSLFICSLAFTQNDLFNYTDKLAILIGSIMSGVVGYLILNRKKEV